MNCHRISRFQYSNLVPFQIAKQVFSLHNISEAMKRLHFSLIFVQFLVKHFFHQLNIFLHIFTKYVHLGQPEKLYKCQN